MRVIDIINLAVEKSGVARRDELDSKMKTTVLGFLNEDYETIYRAYAWDQIKLFNLTTTTLSGVVTLPQYVDIIRAGRVNNQNLTAIGEVKLNLIAPERFTLEGTATDLLHLAPSPVETQMSSADKIKIYSTSTSDTGVVRVKSIVNGKTEFENISLSGTTAVSSINSSTEILKVTKGETIGRIVITLSDDTEIGYIQPDATNAEYKKIQIIENPGDAITVTFQCDRRFERLVSDYDSSVIPIENALVSYLSSQCYRHLADNHISADREETRADKKLQTYFDQQELNSEKDLTMIPEYGMFGNLGLLNGNNDFSVTGINNRNV